MRDPHSTREGLERTLAELIEEYRKHAPLLRAVNELASYEPAVEQYWRAAINDFATLIAERIAREQTSRGQTSGGQASRGQASRGQTSRGQAAGDRATTTATWIAWGTERTIAMHVATHPDDTRSDAALAAGIAAATWATMQHL